MFVISISTHLTPKWWSSHLSQNILAPNLHVSCCIKYNSDGAGDIISVLDQRTQAAGNRRRQTVLLSATLHANLGTLATLSLTQPVSVGIQ